MDPATLIVWVFSFVTVAYVARTVRAPGWPYSHCALGAATACRRSGERLIAAAV